MVCLEYLTILNLVDALYTTTSVKIKRRCEFLISHGLMKARLIWLGGDCYYWKEVFELEGLAIKTAHNHSIYNTIESICFINQFVYICLHHFYPDCRTCSQGFVVKDSKEHWAGKPYGSISQCPWQHSYCNFPKISFISVVGWCLLKIITCKIIVQLNGFDFIWFV